MDGSPLLSLAALRDRAVDVAAVNQKLSDKIARLRERNRELTEELEQLSRAELQALAKARGIRANQKSRLIIAQLVARAENQLI